MDIYWYGQACFKLKGKTATVVIDPFDPKIGLKVPKPTDLEADIVLVTHQHFDHNNIAAVPNNPLVIQGPGEYESKGVIITGIGVYHDSSQGSERGKNTIYGVNIDGLNIVHVGDLGHELTEEQVQEIGETDILMIPVGGNYTIDAKTASKVVAALEPRIVIPMHYKIAGLSVELAGVEDFLKEMGVESPAPINKLTITKEKLPEELQVLLLNKS